ncbi:unnamed protein product [Pieris macdunnoughi]|uniref:Uncharacterized protein n=1 Tax=Pieris macdunnoughi TaxID=345717 RepID=A0A821TWZ5_9NEOP|nr:unnamed protein product [Pieris macdunnoughi]
MPKRCVFGCAPSDASLHSFPNPKRFHQQLNAWVDLTGDFGLTYEEIYKKKKFDVHFTDRDHNHNNRLNALAISSLHLNGFHGKLSYPSATVSQEMELNTQLDAASESTAPSKLTVNRYRIHQKQICNLRREIYRLRKSGHSFKAKNKKAKQLDANTTFQKVVKGLRNNLLTKDLVYIDPEDQKQKLIKWEYIELLYAADKSFGELRCLQKLTEEHVGRAKI